MKYIGDFCGYELMTILVFLWVLVLGKEFYLGDINSIVNFVFPACVLTVLYTIGWTISFIHALIIADYEKGKGF